METFVESGLKDGPVSHRYESLAVRVYALLAALSCGLGGVILAGRETRFSGPSFKGPRSLVGWADVPPWELWGVLFLGLGLALILAFGRPWAVHVLRFGMVVHLFLAIGFIASLPRDARAAATGVVAYLVSFALHAVMADQIESRGWQ